MNYKYITCIYLTVPKCQSDLFDLEDDNPSQHVTLKCQYDPLIGSIYRVDIARKVTSMLLHNFSNNAANNGKFDKKK